MSATTDTPSLFTAARIASVLGLTKRRVLQFLRGVPSQGKALVEKGQLADMWSAESLPVDCRVELVRLTKVKGCRDVAHLLAAGVARWTPTIPLSELDQRHLDKAVRVKNALARAIALYAGAPSESVLRVAHEDYQKEFGLVSERQVRRVLDRVIERDAGAERFDDLSLYLDDNISASKGGETIRAGQLDPELLSVFQYLGSVKEPRQPSVEEADLIWFAACRGIQRQVEIGTREKKARRAMIELFGNSAVSLSKNEVALKELLKRKLARYRECGGVFNLFVDQRADKSGCFRSIKLDEESRNLIVGNAAINHSGRVAPALRELRAAGKLDSDVEMHHVSNPSRKSYVPKSIRDQVKPDIRRMKNMVHGPRKHQLGGAYVIRDYEDCAAGDWYQADDVTLGTYFHEETERGQVRMRGQFLVMIDVRTDYVLGFLLIPERNYDSLAIRSLVTICAAKHGLPRRGFYLERGIWKSSRIIAGKRDVMPFGDTDRGLRGLGMELRHAKLPRAKVIERTIGLLQNRIDRLPGYAGRNEILDVRERAQRDFRDVDAGRKPINEVLLSKQQMTAELAKVIDDHNAEPQDGERLKGMSPAEAWECLQGDVPRQGFQKEWRYILASDVRKLKVGRNGITLPYGKRKFVYRDGETGKRVGEHVLAFFDPMLPETIACTDLNRKNPFCVERAQPLSAFDATPEEMAEEMGRIAAHQEYGKTLYWTSRNTLRDHHFIPTVADAETLEIGETIETQRTQISVRQDAARVRVRTNRNMIEKEGLPRELMQSAETMSPETLEALARLKNATTAEESL